jgi:hypothetical protein
MAVTLTRLERAAWVGRSGRQAAGESADKMALANPARSTLSEGHLPAQDSHARHQGSGSEPPSLLLG